MLKSTNDVDVEHARHDAGAGEGEQSAPLGTGTCMTASAATHPAARTTLTNDRRAR
jgi:hypothetical protein